MDSAGRPSRRVTEVVVLTTAMLTFISFWRAGSIVLCDMASTAFYIGGIAEQAVGRAAPWFILAVMSFSACMLAVYVEGSSMFVRGGVYVVVKNALGAPLAKMSVAALIFDYVLTGPISSVSAGQYLAGLLNSLFPLLRIGWHLDPNTFSVIFALLVTAYFWRQNIRGIEESSDKAVKIIRLTGAMGILLLSWSAYTAWRRGFHWPPMTLSFGQDALGWLEGFDWLKGLGAVGLLVGFGHAFLGMSGVESLAQVYREMEAPKVRNLKRAALLIFLFAFTLTTLSTFFAVSIIPDAERFRCLDNLLGGLSMSLAGPYAARLAMHVFVVVVGAMILSGAVNTAIVGANGMLNRLAEDGILPDWLRWLHPRYGTTHRMVNLVVLLQAATIVGCRGDVYLLGEAYAFGMVWSLVFNTLSLMVLRFKDRSPREWEVPLNLTLPGGFRFPVGLLLILLVVLSVAVANLCTKKVATVWGVSFTTLLFLFLLLSEKMNQRHAAAGGEHREKLNLRNETDIRGVLKEIDKPRRVLVSIKNPKNMFVLSRVLDAVDAETTDVVVAHSKIGRSYMLYGDMASMGPDEERLFTRVIAEAEKHGKSVIPLLLVSNDPFYAMAQAALAVGAQEVVVGVSEQIRAEDQIERLAMTLGAISQPSGAPIRARIVWPDGRRMEADLS